MNTVNFDELGNLHACFINLGCLAPVTKHWDLLSSAWNGEHDNTVMYGAALAPLGLADAVDILARTIIYDTLVIDEIAAQKLTIPIVAELHGIPCLSACRIHRDIYSAAQKAASGLYNHFKTTSPFWTDADGFQLGIQEKHVHEAIGTYGFANSGDGFARTVFYVEIGRQGRIPVMFTTANRSMFANFASIVQSEVHRLIESTTDKKLRGELSNISTPVAALRLSVPPLNEFLIRHARKEGCSILDAARQIRASDEAVAYRAWLGKLQKGWMFQDPKQDIILTKEIQKLQKTADAWLKRGNTGYGSVFTHRVLSLDAIPAVGHILKAFGMEKITVPDIILSGPPKHLQFIASWYT